ncbi:uncharacterized protein LTHEOB_3168 [Lasiodiplodia theobromae]|uniref:uncharacterized protein n=1 Tax=Lasiodiplodia theobromae TaxID=45133 RepID=UPI0015C3A5A2|nr:uncharacterized protein LTHEOB_3168 [Lasiodiplodia theobromae]KAF4534360.1 hypothetical protein LTHEOB_3168 [Lasiodiplodia theobromae]
MSSEHTADPAPHDRESPSLQFDRAAADPPLQPAQPPDPSAAAAPPFQPAPPPDPGAAAAAPCLPPIRTFRQSFHSHSGHRGLTIWQSRWIHAQPPLSFQVYLTFAIDEWTTWEIEAFAETLWYQCTPPPPPPTTAEEWQQQQQQPLIPLPQLLAHEPHSLPIRIDITILGPVAEHTRNITCMQHYRMTRHLDNVRIEDGTDWLWPASPSFRGPNGVQYEGFLIQILDPAYLVTGGLSLVFFDAMAGTKNPADDKYDALVWVPAVPTEGDGNLWTRELCRVWETMSMVKEWSEAFYKALAVGKEEEENREVASSVY